MKVFLSKIIIESQKMKQVKKQIKLLLFVKKTFPYFETREIVFTFSIVVLSILVSLYLWSSYFRIVVSLYLCKFLSLYLRSSYLCIVVSLYLRSSFLPIVVSSDRYAFVLSYRRIYCIVVSLYLHIFLSF